MNKAIHLKSLLFFLIVIFISCSNNDDDENTIDNFYSGALSSATMANLTGTWAIFSAEFDGIQVDVPIDYQDCGRDFFVYSDNGSYTEYLYQNSDCEIAVNPLSFELNNGVITIFNAFGQSEDYVITRLTSNNLTFKARFDVDEDGALDILTIYAQRYVPVDIDLVSATFMRNQDEAYQNLLSFTWDPYQGSNDFSRYEIYRSSGDNCSTQNGVLLETITDDSVTEFTDLSPPGEARLCYYLKTYTNQGLLGQSQVVQIDTYTLIATPVAMNEPLVNNDQIELSWEESDLPYFSHYEIVFSNFPGNITGYGLQENQVTVINDRSVTSYVDENPPYLENPYYNIYVSDIFGNRTYSYYEDVSTNWEVGYKRDEIIEMKRIQSFTIDPEMPVVYFFGEESMQDFSIKIHRFNYMTNQTEAISDISPSNSTSLPIKVFNSVSNGKEIILEQGSELHIYDAQSLEYKYALNPQEVSSINDFILTNSGYWVLTDGDNVFTYERDNANFFIVDSKPHFTEFQSSYYYQAFEMNNDKLLVGHKNEENSMIYSIDSNGFMTFNQTVPIPIRDSGQGNTLYNAAQNYIVNFNENRLYSTTSFSFLESFEQPYYPSGISVDGFEMLGSNNDPNWSITLESLHAKEAVIYNKSTQALNTTETLGYPHILFQDYNGDIMSISSGLKKEDIGQNINDKADVFIETLVID